uniref:PX domain-containing protein n=1 Tax=Electrophorus electricus TaxID=8005 RepID=A0AAY5EA24_ELEEL
MNFFNFFNRSPMAKFKALLESFRRAFKIDMLREVARQYPFIFLCADAFYYLSRYLHVLMIFWSFLAGAVTFYCSLSPDYLVPSVFFSVKTKDKLFPHGHSCAVCGKNKCKRHRPALLMENYQPWLGLKVHSKVDASIGEVLELVLENFVYPWYRDITDDEACVDELRQTFRFFASVMVRRAQKVDVPSVVTGKMMKAAMKHIEIIAKANEKVKNPEALQQAALEEYGADLHFALRSRQDELHYLRTLTDMLFPYIMPPKATECRSLALLIREVMTGSVFLPTMDFVADPDTVNHMVLIFIDDTPPEQATEPPSSLVPFLQKYADSRNRKHSVLKLDLKTIRKQQDLLFHFMSFLKQEGAVHVLQFCLTEFNDKILHPELSDSEMQHLHREVQKLYETYCLEESIDKISFDPFIIEEIHNIAQGPYTGVVKLQTMPCLFEAYEHVLSLLENVFTPLFCHSDEVIHSMFRHYPLKMAPKRGDSFGIGRIGSKLKGVFKSTTMEGAMVPNYAMVEGEEDQVEEGTVVVEDDAPAPAEVVSTPGVQRNLSAWTISIPYIDFYEDEAKKERVPVFCIDVERHDRQPGKALGHEAEKWSVYRRYLEFYVLESKLTEFHGSFQDAQLPSKRIIGPKNFEFLTSKRGEFEGYLQNLLGRPELSNSQLLADFLSPHSMETQFLEKMLPDVNLGRIFKSVPGKLMKEKGQNLEPFLQSFFISCDSPKPRPSRPEVTIPSPTAKLYNDLYKNNADQPDSTNRKYKQNFFMEVMEMEGVYDYMMYVGRVVFRIPDWVHHMMCGGRILFKRTLEAYMEHYLQSKLDKILQEHRLISLITLLRDAVFCETNEERSPEDKRRRAKQTFQEMMGYLPDMVVKCMGEENQYEGVQLLFSGIQQPLLNKQMTYVLLDIAIQELFPESGEFLFFLL